MRYQSDQPRRSSPKKWVSEFFAKLFPPLNNILIRPAIHGSLLVRLVPADLYSRLSILQLHGDIASLQTSTIKLRHGRWSHPTLNPPYPHRRTTRHAPQILITKSQLRGQRFHQSSLALPVRRYIELCTYQYIRRRYPRRHFVILKSGERTKISTRSDAPKALMESPFESRGERLRALIPWMS